jgi:hypothetical protein
MALPLLVPLLLLGMVLGFLALSIPWSIFMRYRAGSARRKERGWVTGINLFASVISSITLMTSAAIGNLWIPNALPYTSLGWVGGCLLGILGLLATRWERTVRGLYYTPNKWLILTITLLVSARIYYGFWRAWHAWRTTPDEQSWIAHSGAAGSMAAGALILGYYVIYWIGVQRVSAK